MNFLNNSACLCPPQADSFTHLSPGCERSSTSVSLNSPLLYLKKYKEMLKYMLLEILLLMLV